MQGQIQRLLEIAYSDKTTLTLDKTEVNIKELIQQAVSGIQPLITQKNATINVVENENTIIANVDNNYLQLALINILENAIKYSALPKIKINIEETINDVLISIADNGIGIDEKYHKKIFDKFYRVPNGEIHQAKGFGLGLSFVKNVIEAHNGSIKVNSQPGNGSTFIISITKNK